MSLAEWQNQLSQALVLPLRDCSEDDFVPGFLDLHALQGVDAQKLALYQELMFNTVLESLESIYPFTHQLISENGQRPEVWEAFAECYRRAYPNPSHQLMSAVENFPQFIAEQAEWMGRFPFIAELAWYEWLEMKVLNLPNRETSDIVWEKRLPDVAQYGEDAPVWNTVRALRTFSFPIPDIVSALKEHKAQAELERIEPQTTEILIYRDPVTLQVRFFCLNSITSLLLQLSLAHPELSYQEVISRLQAEVPDLHSLPLSSITEQASPLFHHCLAVGVLLGSQSLYPNS